MAGISTLEELLALLRAEGVNSAWVKHLSPKQDNEKNQIYLGGSLDGVTNLFPAVINTRAPSTSETKPGSKAGQPILEMKIDFAWLDRAGHRHDAPGVRIIDYFQYPEVRMSGFLGGCDAPPDALRRDRQAEYGRRILVMGTATDGTVVGLVLTELEDPLVASFPELPLLGGRGVLAQLSVDAAPGTDPAVLLRAEIAAIVAGGWHRARILRPSGLEPFSGSQAGGYTLEALLGVVANGNKAPDRHGFEVKGYSGSRISLMTPTPDYGFQGENSFRDFMAKYGRPGEKDDGSRRFTGLHKAGSVNEKTGLAIRVAGLDPESGEFTAGPVGVELWDPGSGDVVAGWSLGKMANCWNAKHANALYIRFAGRDGAEGAEYRYADEWLTGSGTDVWKLLRAIASGLIFYDPADTIYADGKPKVRSQWRINARDLPGAMKLLYATSETANA